MTALEREVLEECQCKLIDCSLLGCVLDEEIRTNEKCLQLRYVGRVSVIEEAIEDPAGKAIAREIVDAESASQYLAWGERGNMLLKEARRKFERLS